MTYILMKGTVDEDDTGLATIVIRDSNDKFVLLTQAFINPDNTFERSVDTNEKFSKTGIYNATAFLVNMTEGSLVRFDFTINKCKSKAFSLMIIAPYVYYYLFLLPSAG